MKDTLETSRLWLRPFEEGDAEAMFSNWAKDPEVTKWLTWNPHGSVEATKSFVRKWIEDYGKEETIRFAIVLKDENELIGSIDVVSYDEGVPEIGYCLAKRYWNKGYMTESCRRVLAYLKELGYERVRIDAAVENLGSNRVIQKCGGVFQKSQILERPLKHDSVPVNSYIVYL